MQPFTAARMRSHASAILCKHEHRGCEGHLSVGSHGQVVALVPVLLAPDVGAHSAEHAHHDLHQDDEGDLEVEEVVEGACATVEQ